MEGLTMVPADIPSKPGGDIIKKKLISMGAEAYLYEGSWFERHVIFKQRLPKKYRLPPLDNAIRTQRTLNEARALIKIKKYGVNVPAVYEIDTHSMTIVMQFIKGQKLRNVLDNLSTDQIQDYFIQLGQYIAILHQNGHIHGDITTSNVILTPHGELFLIDFGLHVYSDSIEDKSVDLHLLKRVLMSSHAHHFNTCFHSFLEGYRKEYSPDAQSMGDQIINHISVIESRGRYVKKEERL